MVSEEPLAACEVAASPASPSACASSRPLLPVSGAGLASLEEEFSDAFEEVFGDDADGCEELLVAPSTTARKRLPARPLAYVDEAEIRAAEAFFAQHPPAEPLCLGWGDGSLEEELAAAKRVLVRTEHGWVDEADFALDAVDVPEDPCEEASSQDFLIEEPDSQESFSSMDVDGTREASSQDTLSGQPDSQGSFSSMDLDEEDEMAIRSCTDACATVTTSAPPSRVSPTKTISSSEPDIPPRVPRAARSGERAVARTKPFGKK